MRFVNELLKSLEVSKFIAKDKKLQMESMERLSESKGKPLIANNQVNIIMAKLVIPVNDLPAPSMTNSTYEVRFRITSEDKNRVSAWTPIFTVDPELQYFVDGDIALLYTDVGATSSSWDSVSIMKDVDGTLVEVAKVDEFDIWIRWAGSGGANPGNWIYQGRIASNSIAITVPALYAYGVSSTAVPQFFYIEVYRPSKERVQNTSSDFLMYSGSISLAESSISSINTDITNINTDINTLYLQDEDNFAISVVL